MPPTIVAQCQTRPPWKFYFIAFLWIGSGSSIPSTGSPRTAAINWSSKYLFWIDRPRASLLLEIIPKPRKCNANPATKHKTIALMNRKIVSTLIDEAFGASWWYCPWDLVLKIADTVGWYALAKEANIRLAENMARRKPGQFLTRCLRKWTWLRGEALIEEHLGMALGSKEELWSQFRKDSPCLSLPLFARLH